MGDFSIIFSVIHTVGVLVNKNPAHRSLLTGEKLTF